MIPDILYTLSFLGGLAVALGLVMLLAWVTTAELYSIWMHRTGRRVVTRYPDERDL